ncbi:MAG: hypothetical protein ACQETO_13270, partial [Pseudomonadota bacterium]
GVNANKTAIYYFELDDTLSDANTMHYTVMNLTKGEPINAIENIEIASAGRYRSSGSRSTCRF